MKLFEFNKNKIYEIIPKKPNIKNKISYYLPPNKTNEKYFKCLSPIYKPGICPICDLFENLEELYLKEIEESFIAIG